jgi:hypothetical protein
MEFRALVIFMHMNFLLPLVIVFFFINPLVKVHVVPEYLSEGSWISARFAVLAMAIATKMTTLKPEIQFQFNESYTYVQSMMADPHNETKFKVVQILMAKNFRRTWVTVLFSVSMIVIPLLLSCSFIQRVVLYAGYVNESQFDFSFVKTLSQTPSTQSQEGIDLDATMNSQKITEDPFEP